MSEQRVKEIIANTFMELAEGLQTGSFGKNYTIGLCAEGSEHGEDNLIKAIKLAEEKGFKAVLINGENPHSEMERMLEAGEIDGAVTMHYPFPIGVSTVGKVITPAVGKAMYIATTTGTADTDRVCAMIKNAIYGIIAAKADGIENPTVGIINIDGARQCEKALLKLAENGYPINFAESARADGGIVMRGNDLLQGTPDVMVMDSLTGNLLIKMFSSYTTGGGYEATGWGYGPGIGEGFDKTIMIISRASGAPVIAGAIEYATNLLKHKVNDIANAEFKKAREARLDQILSDIMKPKQTIEAEVKAPPQEVVTEQIPGVEVMDLDDAVKELWKSNIYAESGMGCTGPIIRISEGNKEKAITILTEKEFL